MSLDEGGSQAQSISVSAASVLGDHLTGTATTNTTNTTTEEALGASMDLEASEAYITGSTHMQKQHQLDTSHILQASLASLGSNTAADAASQQVLSAAPSTNATGVEGSEDARMASPSTSAIVSPSFISSDAASTSAQTTFALSQLQPENPQPQILSTPGPILMLNSSSTESVCTSVPSMASIPSNADSSSRQQQQMVHGSILAQQAAFVAAMNSSTQLNIPTAALNTQYIVEKHAANLPLQTSPVSHTNHSRSTSVVDGMVAMFPGDSSNAVTPRSGIMVVPTMAGSSTQPMAAQIQLQLQLHQQQLEQQLAASNASAFASANHSGAPSPYAALSDPSTAETIASAHRRQLSNTTPGAFQQQKQPVLTETPTSLSTAPPTLVPGTPMSFGQLQFPPAQLSSSADAPYSHHQHPHFGHSRHLSLDNANFRLSAGEASAAFYALPPHATVQEHQAGISQGLQSRAALIALQQQAQQAQQMQQQQLFQQQLQVQAHALAQQKAAATSSRTVPITPQTPMTNGSTAGAFQASSLADSLIQHQQHNSHHQQHNSHHRSGLMHHSSASVDLGALSSAFNVAQLNYTLSGQNSPVGVQSAMASAVGVPQMQHLPHLFGVGVHPQDLTKQEPLAGSGAEMARSDDDGCDDDGSSSEATDKEANGATKGSSNSGAVRCSTGRTKRQEAPYKRFRNSFIFFANDRRQQWKRDHPEVKKIQNRGFIQCMGKVWNNMSAEEKAPYMRMAEDDKLRYEADVKRYGPLPTSTPSTSASSSGAGTAANSTPTALSNSAQAPASLTAEYLRSSETSSGSLQVSIPSVVPIAPAPALAVNVATIPTAVPTGNAIGINVGSTPAINTAHTNAAVAITQPTPIAPAYISHSHPLPVEAGGVNPALLSQQSYQMMLQQTFGQGLSPQAVEFDPSCFVGPEAQSADASTVCFNPFSGTSTVITEGGIQQQQQQQLSTALYDRRGSIVATKLPDPTNSNDASNDGGTDTPGSSSKPTANGPPITTLVGTKRKSSSDGQPMTSLPVSIKRFRNSFIYFVDARRQELLFDSGGAPTNVELNNRAFLKEMSAKWRIMSEEEKAPYLRMAEADKERFTREMREYELEHPEEFSKQSRHRRRRSSTASNGISAGSAGLDPALAEPAKLQSATAAAAATMPFMPPLSAGAYGLNISLTGMASSGSASPNGLLPFSQNVVADNINSALALSAVPIEAMAQELGRAVATSVNTPISTAVSTPLTTPLLSPNVSLPDKTEMLQLSIGHIPSLPSVPEEVVVGTNAAMSTTVASSVGMAGSTPGYLATAPKVATLPTVLEGADEDVNMI